jgi:hypothetical protein
MNNQMPSKDEQLKGWSGNPKGRQRKAKKPLSTGAMFRKFAISPYLISKADAKL